MLACTLLLIPVAGMGLLYTITVVVAGLVFATSVVRLWQQLRGAGAVQPMRVFHLSISYLSVVFLAVAVDPFLG